MTPIRRLTLVAAPLAGILLVGALVVQAKLGGGSILSASAAAGTATAITSSAVTSTAGTPPAKEPSPASISAEGRVVTYPGGEVVVGADVAGTIERLLVKEQDRVRRGQLLAILDARDLEASRDESKARVAEAAAEVRLAETEIERARRLVAEGVIAQQDLDRRLRDLDASIARRDSAAASVARYEALIARTRITSPIDGVVIDRRADAGETIDRGAALLTIADLARTRIEAEVDEFDAGRVRLNARAAVTAEGHEGASWSGSVEEIPDAVVARGLRPQDPGRPTDSRVLLVKVALESAAPLKLGQRVEVRIQVPRAS